MGRTPSNHILNSEGRRGAEGRQHTCRKQSKKVCVLYKIHHDELSRMSDDESEWRVNGVRDERERAWNGENLL